MLADPAVREQVQSLQKEMNSPDFKNRYAGFSQAYQQGSTVQNARTAWAEFNNTAADLGEKILSYVNRELREFKSILDGIRSFIPHAPNPATGDPGTPDLMGKVVTGVLGVGKAGVMGAASVFMEMNNGTKNTLGIDRAGTYTSPGKTGRPAEPIVVKPQPVTLNLNIDGRTLAQAISGVMASYYTFSTGAASADGLSQSFGGDHNMSD